MEIPCGKQFDDVTQNMLVVVVIKNTINNILYSDASQYLENSKIQCLEYV